MDKHELASELDQDGARQLLETGALMRLAYNGHDGTPRVIPIGFLWNGTEVVFCTVDTSPKVRAIKSKRDVALTIDAGTTPAEARSLLIRGPAKVEIVEGVPTEYIDAARKTMDPEQVAGFETEVNRMYDRMARISIVPTWARFYDFGAGRLPGFLQELVGQKM
jgi:nitroimidazol reductase NimA-like FMN-containing flavoprotein (pyridoxamine 5'-phosphate oxidase superfamily)